MEQGIVQSVHQEGRKEMFYLTTHSTFTVIWRQTYG